MSIFGKQKYLTMEVGPFDFLKILLRFRLSEPHFLIKNRVHVRFIRNLAQGHVATF